MKHLVFILPLILSATENIRTKQEARFPQLTTKPDLEIMLDTERMKEDFAKGNITSDIGNNTLTFAKGKWPTSALWIVGGAEDAVRHMEMGDWCCTLDLEAQKVLEQWHKCVRVK